MLNNKKIYCFLFALYLLPTQAQTFIKSAKIEYERKTYVKKVLLEVETDPQDASWLNQLPDYRLEYFNLTISGNQSIYQPGREYDSKMPEWMSKGVTSTVYANYDSGVFLCAKQILDQNYYIADSLPKIQWKYTNDTRTIAGYNCRRVTGRICDSLFIVAYYAEEILLQGGPETFNGLPGLILGVVVPRMHISWYATKVEIANTNEEPVPPKPTRKQKQIKLREMLKEIEENVTDWGKWKTVIMWQAAV